MRELKRTGIRIFLCAEVLVFAGFYIFGSSGMPKIFHLQHEIHLLQTDLSTLKFEISQLEGQIALQKTHPFFQEKIAREQLQMARTDEQIFIY